MGGEPVCVYFVAACPVIDLKTHASLPFEGNLLFRKNGVHGVHNVRLYPADFTNMGECTVVV